MNAIQNKRTFQDQELVTWHCREGNKMIPVPAVVLHEGADGVTIRTRIQGQTREVCVSSEELVER